MAIICQLNLTSLLVDTFVPIGHLFGISLTQRAGRRKTSGTSPRLLPEGGGFFPEPTPKRIRASFGLTAGVRRVPDQAGERNGQETADW